jgi:hypothetical protein
MKILFVLVVSALVLIPGVSGEGEALGMDIQGVCRNYNVTLSLYGFPEGCYDVKIDVTSPAGRVGEIFDPREGWKSSFFYIREGFCVEESEGVVKNIYRLRTDSSSGVLNFAGSLRFGSRSWQTGYYSILQDCPEGFDEAGPAFWLGVLLALVVIASGLVFYLYYRDK